MELRSHPDKKLIDHLYEVAQIAKSSVEGKGFNFSLSPDIFISHQQLIDLVWLTGAFHDLAKATVYFQEYIRNPEKPHSRLKNHALLSSLFAYYVSKKYIDEQVDNALLKELLPIFVLTAVKRHHGNIGNIDTEILFDDDQCNLLIQQVNSIDKSEITPMIDILLSNFHLDVHWDLFVNFIKEREFDQVFDDFCFDVLEDEYLDLPIDLRFKLFYLHQTIYSALMFSDKNDVVLEDLSVQIPESDFEQKLNDFREKNGFNNPQSEINRLKNEAFFQSLLNLDQVFSKEKHIYSVTLPTGLGKTLTCFSIAGKIRKLAKLHNSKVIINIPFTSIIDQNFEVYKDVISTDSSKYILKHHHLAEPLYKTGSENALDLNKSQFLIETWQTETVVTTFVQFLESVLSCDKTKLMKLVHLKNSVVILDEIQTVPYPLWETIRESFKILGDTYNIYFILVSATQPLIFCPGEDIIEIVPDYQNYFRFFNRTQMHYHSDPVSFNDFIERIIKYIIENPAKDILVILNTKDATRMCFESISTSLSDDSKFYYLSTLITPYERKEIIKRIKQKGGTRKVVISTQLIEAGVDISVDTVFRQLAPIDSLIQSAGRANRYYEKESISDVFIFDIEEFRKATNMIYGNDLIIKTKNVLKDFCRIEESSYLQLIKRYFNEVRKQSDETSSPLLSAILKLKFGNVNLKLIEERKTESVFIQLNQEAQSIWNQFIEICEAKDVSPWERKEKFSSIKSKFYDYVINIPVPWNESSIAFDSDKICNFYLSEYNNPSRFYSYSEGDFRRNTGYNSELKTVFL